MGVEEIFDQAQTLSEVDQIRLVDSLLHALHKPDPEVEREWLELALSRLRDFDAGVAKTVSGEVVLERLRQRIARR